MVRRPELVYLFALCLAATTAAAGGQSSGQRAHSSFPVLSPQQIFKRVAPSVMVVESLDAKGAVIAFGSGVVVAPGRVVTNRHVIEDGIRFRVEHGGRTWPAKLVRVDPDHDLAELSVPGLTAPAVHVRPSSTLNVGEKVYAIGSPEGLELTISEGLISGLRDFDRERVIQTSAAISPGSSGGGLFDSEGRLVGITTFYLKGGQSLNFALPAEWSLAVDRQPKNAARAPRSESLALSALVWFELGLKAQDVGKCDLAVRDYKQAMRLKPDYSAAWRNLGLAYIGIGQLQEAVGAFEQAVSVNPNDEPAWFCLGALYGNLGKYSEAVGAEEKALGLKPSYGRAWYVLGFVFDKLGQHDKAVSAQQQASRLMQANALSTSPEHSSKIEIGTVVRNTETGQVGIVIGFDPRNPEAPVVWPVAPSAARSTDTEQDLPVEEVAKLGGHAEFTGWNGQMFEVNLYNGSSWKVSSITIRLDVPDEGISRVYRLTASPSLGGDTSALSNGLYEEYLDFTVVAGEKWGWHIVSAQGFPPKK
ncbi:MAG: trypsin-like peptidase domain-containing protein [Terriglobia bacterium]